MLNLEPAAVPSSSARLLTTEELATAVSKVDTCSMPAARMLVSLRVGALQGAADPEIGFSSPLYSEESALAIVFYGREIPAAALEATTPTGMAITACGACGVSHPVGRGHCGDCGRPSLFISPAGVCLTCAAPAAVQS